MLGVRAKAIKITDRHRRYLFVFESSKERDATFSAIVDKWNRALTELDLLLFIEVPVGIVPVGMGKLFDDQQEFSPEYQASQLEAQGEWEDYFKKHGRKTGMVEDTEKLYSLLKATGIPDAHRSWAWPLFSGAIYKSHCAPQLGLYHSLLGESIDEDTLEQIRKDIHRSFPAHELFQTVSLFPPFCFLTVAG